MSDRFVPGKRSNSGDMDVLGRAVRAWNRAGRGAETLGQSARERILREALEGNARENEASSPLFSPRRWLLAAAVLPAVLATVTLALISGLEVPAPGSNAVFTRVEASKAGNEVVFRIANGSTEHVVYRSMNPSRFEPGSGVKVTNGVYRDRLAAGDLVFYRID